jgi:uncharacterized integral membrane protein
MIRLILLAPLVVLVILFGLSNREPVALRLWPLDGALTVSLSVAVLVIAALAFLFGALVAWAGSLAHRRRAARMEEAARVLEAELTELRGRLAREVDGSGPVPSSAAPRGTAAGTSVVPLRRSAA